MAVFSGNGSAAAPSFTFSSDTNLGIYREGADKLGFATGGTGRMFLDSSGRLGIGTTSPDAQLEIGSTTAATGTGVLTAFEIQRSDSTNPLLSMGPHEAAQSSANPGASICSNNRGMIISNNKTDLSEGEGIFLDGVNSALRLYANDSERARITSDGKLGLGTSAPSTRLHVVDGISYLKLQKVTVSAGTAFDVTGALGYDAGVRPTFDNVYFDLRGRSQNLQSGGGYDGGIKMQLVSTTGGNEYGSTLIFSTAYQSFSNANNGQERMRIDPEGNVGIGTTSPGATLDVNGSLSKSSGSFKIDHPLPEKNKTHYLVHSFVEAPDASNLYAGMVDLVDGVAVVNIDTAHRMSEGTFEALNTVQSWSSSNESGYAPVKCSIVGNLLTIECQDPNSNDTVYYEVRGIRKDAHMLSTEWTDEEGRVITEPVKEQPIETA